MCNLFKIELISILKNKADDIGVKIHYNSAIIDLLQNSSEATLKFENDQFNCDFVIGADGINSLVRKKFFFDKPPNFLKQVASTLRNVALRRTRRDLFKKNF